MKGALRFPWKVFSRFIFFETMLILLLLLVSGLAARHFFKRQLVEQVKHGLHDSLAALSHALPEAPSHEWCSVTAAGSHLRFTLLSRQGQVICDSHQDWSTMENHASRPEVVEAWREGFGAAVRFSQTLREDMLYGALALPARDQLLRGAIELASVREALAVFDRSLVAFLAVVAAVSALLSLWFGRQLLAPLSRLLGKMRALARVSASPRRENENAGENLHENSHGNAPDNDEDATRDEAYGEWSEFEASLEEVRRDLQDKIESLVLERQQQATLMSAISDAILAVDRDGRLLFYNSRFAVLFREARLERRPRLWETLREPEVLNAFRSAIRDGLPASGGTLAREEGDKRLYFSVLVSPLRKGDGESYGAVGVFHDVTELKHAERMRIDFVANVSHELRTPLTAIKGYTDTLVDDARQGRPLDLGFLEVIERNSERLLSLIDDLLDLSTLESVEIPQKSWVDTAELTRGVIAGLDRDLEDKRHQLVVEPAAAAVYADPRRVVQVLINLLDNARKYTPAEGRITIRWENVQDPRGVLLKVSDTGPGIPPEHQGRIFERFYRIDKARSRALGGTGLGLSIVKHIMQRHGGTVWVESQPGAGATFVCRFPG